jgi:hypothetical protein
MTMNFDALAGLVEGGLLGRLEAQAAKEPMSVTFYRCQRGHQAAKVHRGTDTFPAIAHLGPGNTCLRCMGEFGEQMEMK